MEKSDFWIDYYEPPNPKFWHGRVDDVVPLRLHEKTICIDLRSNEFKKNANLSIGLIGFSCDEGVLRNWGRVGAASGPSAFREALCNLATESGVYDFGNINCFDGDLEKSQKALSVAVSKVYGLGLIPFVIGGGHELGYGQYLGLQQANLDKDIAIVNFDAHFDMRVPIDGKMNSGTSFYQIAEDLRKNKREFLYYCVGIQQFGNTKALFDIAQKNQVKFVCAESIHTEGLSKAEELLDELLQTNKQIYLTICLDVFASTYAPGVSAPQPLGLTPWQVIPLLEKLMKSNKVVGISIAELSPPNDINNMTAKLAAALAAHCISIL